MFANLFVLLYVAHLIADYALQTDHQATCKSRPGLEGWRANAQHVATHVGCTIAALIAGVLLLDLRTATVPTLLAVAWIGGTHGLIDRRWPIQWWMSRTGSSEFFKHGGAAHVDQTAHVLALAVAAVTLAA